MGTKTTLIAAGLLGAVAVGAGAFGAHALEGQIGEREVELWATATRYLLAHAVVLAALGFGAGEWTRARRLASALFTTGCVVFPATLYVMSLGGPRWLGAITPIGGTCLVAGWCAVAVYGFRWAAARAKRGDST